MKVITILTLTFFLVSANTKAQDYLTRNGSISFFSHTPLEDIQADNNEVASVLNSTTGDIEFKVAIQGFHFKKAAMEQHFNNADYMNSPVYPKAGFKGKITNISAVNFAKDGTYNVTVQGDLTIKDVTKPITANGTVTVKNGVVTAESSFTVARQDYHVVGESFVQKRIAPEIKITVNCQYEKR